MSILEHMLSIMEDKLGVKGGDLCELYKSCRIKEIKGNKVTFKVVENNTLFIEHLLKIEKALSLLLNENVVIEHELCEGFTEINQLWHYVVEELKASKEVNYLVFDYWIHDSIALKEEEGNIKVIVNSNIAKTIVECMKSKFEEHLSFLLRKQIQCRFVTTYENRECSEKGSIAQ